MLIIIVNINIITINVINIIIRYREGENILCFRNEAETRKHLDSMASDADRFIMIGIIIVLINITIIEFPPLFKYHIFKNLLTFQNVT